MSKQYSNGVSLQSEALMNVHCDAFHCQENTSIAERSSNMRQTKFTDSTNYNQ
jgi:hypothetical protein